MARNYKTVGPFVCQNPHCGKSFMGYPGNPNRVCSKRCGKRKYPIRESQCSVCNKQFEIKSFQHSGRFCSEGCRRDTKIIKTCPICEQVFKFSHSHKRQFCSRRCHFIDRTRTIEERFWKKVDRSGDCWLWMGSKNRRGYGTILHNNKIALAHRVVYELTYGSIEKKSLCLHRCDNPACVNPEHLRLGTQLENMRECIAKGRMRKGHHGMTVRLAIWNKILEFYDHSCGLCGSKEFLVQDHFIPLSKNGTINWDNVWPLCKSCNQKKRTKILPINMPHVDALRDTIHG